MRRVLWVSILVWTAGFSTVAHATTYKRFTSRICPYAIDYPGGWKASGGQRSDTFTHETSASRFAAIVLVCTRADPHVTVKQLTLLEMQSYRKQGYTLNTPHYGNRAGIFTGHTTLRAGTGHVTAILEVTIALLGRRGWIFVLGGDVASFRQALPLYGHMIDSFRTR